MSIHLLRKRDRWQRALPRGLVAGVCATEALDWLSTVLYQGQDLRSRLAEDQARGYRHVYEVAVEALATRVGLRPSRSQVARWGWRFHKAFGFLGGPAYLALRRAFPWLRRGCGLAFGTVFFLV